MHVRVKYLAVGGKMFVLIMCRLSCVHDVRVRVAMPIADLSIMLFDMQDMQLTLHNVRFSTKHAIVCRHCVPFYVMFKPCNFWCNCHATVAFETQLEMGKMRLDGW